MYGVTNKMRSDVITKIDKYHSFLNSHYVEFSGRKFPLSLFFKNSFINSDRYVAELQHRVWSLVEYAQNRDLVNVFLTLTLPSEYHRKKTLRNGRLIRNHKFAHQDIKIYDIYTRKRPEYLYIHNFRIHKSLHLNYWTGKTRYVSFFKRNLRNLAISSIDVLFSISTYDDLKFFCHSNGYDFVEFYNSVISKKYRDVEIYDIYSRERVLYYNKLVFSQKPIASFPRWDGTFKRISLKVDDYLPNVASKHLTNMWRKIRDDRVWKSIPPEDRVYFRVTEPHKDGTPHLHISIFIPKEFVSSFIDSVFRLFPCPVSNISTSYIPDGYCVHEDIRLKDGSCRSVFKRSSDSLNYIDVHIVDVVGYLMKYVLKTIDDMRDGAGITDLSVWYIYNRITRFYTSRTLISLNVYRPLNGRFKLIELTEYYKGNELSVWLNPDNNSPEIIQFNDYILWRKKPLELKQFGRDDTSRVRKIYLNAIDVEIDGVDYVMYRADYVLHKKRVKFDTNCDVSSSVPIVSRLKNFQLYSYFNSLNIDDPSLNLQHYALVHNEMVFRGLLDDVLFDLNDYSSNLFDFGVYDETYVS